MSLPDVRSAIRLAEASDAELLARLSAQTFNETFAEYNTPSDMKLYLEKNCTPEILARELADHRTSFFLYESEGRTVAYTKLHRGPVPTELKAARAVEVARLYVLKSHIGHSIGRMMMDHNMKTALTEGYDRIWLGVWEHNRKAIGFYEKLGFEKFGSHVFVVGTDPQTDWLLKKDLRHGG